MVERNDPARTGVKAGRVVGLLTAALATASLLSGSGAYVEGVRIALGLLGIDPGFPVSAVLVIEVGVVASTRYAIGYVIGSLVGVVYDWLERPSLVVLFVIVLLVGTTDGMLAGIGARSPLLGGAYLLAWLCYLPVFARFRGDEEDEHSAPRRLGEA